LKSRKSLLRKITDVLFAIIVAIIVIAVIALLIWNEVQLVEECEAEGHSRMYCIRMLN
jgi:phosphotransferase system  glucose/maltose/N-acetylglucosamine-specific IIC component